MNLKSHSEISHYHDRPRLTLITLTNRKGAASSSLREIAHYQNRPRLRKYVNCIVAKLEFPK